MKYIFSINSRVNLSESAECKHERLIEFLKNIESPWGISHETEILFPGFDRQDTAILSLSKFLKKGIKMNVFYPYRVNKADNHHLMDDRVHIVFDEKKIDYPHLINTIFPAYIKCFDAYTSAIFPEQLIFLDFESSMNKNFRQSIVRFYPVNFYDSKFCNNVFKKSPIEISKILKGHINSVQIFDEGIIIAKGELPISINECNDFDQKVKSLLNFYE